MTTFFFFKSACNALSGKKLKVLILASMLCGCFGPSAFSQTNSVATPVPPPPPDAPGTVGLPIGWLKVTGVNQIFPVGQTEVSVTYKSNGAEVTASIPVEADTYLWKDSTVPMGEGKGLLLRDNRYSEALIKLDLSDIPKDAQVEKASLKFKLGGVERKQQPGTFSCFLIKTPWEESATWVKPQADGENWNGLASGKDFDPAAFGTVDIPVLDDKQKGGQIVEIPGFETVLQKWLSGETPNNGFLLTFNGKAVQVGLPAREAMDVTRTITLGGEKNGKMLLAPNLPLFDRLLLKPDDLLGAHLMVSIAKLPKTIQSSAAEIKVYQVEDGVSAPGELVGSFPVKNLPLTGVVDLLDLAPTLKKNLAGAHDTKQEFLLAVEGGEGTPPEIQVFGAQDHKQLPGINLVVHDYPAAYLYGDVPVHPQPGVFAKVVDGHLTYGGKRLRLWGVVGYPHVDRLVKMGFNAQRVWEPSSKIDDAPGKGIYTTESAKKGEFVPYQKGDGSRIDVDDKYFADLKAHNFFVMWGALAGTIPFAPLLADDSFVAGGDDWAQWKEAMQMKGAGDPFHYLFIDERLQKIKKAHAKALLTHVNQYTGKTYGEEENIAIYEIANENGFVAKILGGELPKWPPYFKNKLQKKWNQWLSDHYKDDTGLKKAWGSLKDGESLAGGTVAPAPDFDDRTNYPEQRGNDFVDFMIDLDNQWNQDFRTYCRSFAPAGVGINVVPFSFDTFYRPSLQWAYGQHLGDVHLQGMYFWDLKPTLDKPPSAYVIDSYTPSDQPTVLYETNTARPNPYRAEYPLKLAALASYQDWDGVFWHYWAPMESEHDVAYLTSAMALPGPVYYWTAVMHEADPVMCTALALGGRIFLGNRIPPAKDPDVFKVGKQALFSYSAFRGISVADSTFTKGSRISYEPKDDSAVTLNGKPVPSAGRIEKAIASGDYITWDWPNGRLIIDAPTVKAYVGKVDGSFQFSDGITIGNISTPWIVFSMSSADGKPLTGPDATKHILMSGVFDAKNSGFEFNYNIVGGPLDQGKSIRNPGHPPTLVDKVEYKVWFPNQFDGALKSYDFALRETNDTPINKDNEVSQQGATPYMDVLEINQWGEKGTLPVASPTVIAKQDYTRSSQPLNPVISNDASAPSGAIYPIAGMDWSMSYLVAHHYLENSTLLYTSESKLDTSATPDKTVTVTGAQLPSLWNSLADIVLTFSNDKMMKVEVTFKQPPPVSDVETKFTAVLGEPVEKKLEAQYGTTELHWTSKGALPDVFVTESQGIMKIIYQPPAVQKAP